MVIDNYGRLINYLRLSITDHCNLSCLYCRPKINKKARCQILRLEEIIRLVRLTAGMGIKHYRITGGEPLFRRGVVYLVRKLNQIKGVEEISMTTNGVRLAQFGRELKEAGLRRINISLDSLRPDRYRQITGGDFSRVWEGIDEAINLGFSPIKINMVPMKGINEDEVEAFVRLAIEKGLGVRFIEFMPFNQDRAAWNKLHLPLGVVQDRLSRVFNLKPLNGSITGNGPAEHYQVEGSTGIVGFIAPLSEGFCHRCNRLRLTPDGKLRLCLERDIEIDLKSPLRNGYSDEEIKELIRKAIREKPQGHHFHEERTYQRAMSAIGG